MSVLYEVIDLETSVKNRGEGAIGKNWGSPFHVGNDIVWFGSKRSDYAEPETIHKDSQFDSHTDPDSEVKLLVGQNIKFDLLYLMRDDKWREWMHEGRIWDTQLAEHILTAQQHKWASLDDLALKYGGELKDDRLKELWASGVDTEDIDDDLIVPYLEGDLTNTEKVFIAQLTDAKARGMIPLIMAHMDALLATTEMEFNGMAFNKAGCTVQALQLRVALGELTVEMSAEMALALGLEAHEVNPFSAQQVSTLLFGGKIKYTAHEKQVDENGEAIVYKSGAKKGQIKTKKVTLTEDRAGYSLDTSLSTPTKKPGVYKVDDGVLKSVIDKYAGGIPGKFCKLLLKARELKKDISTYYEGYSDLVWPDGKIHGTLSHAATATGRLSHSQPNLGNVSHSND